jgi:hypothetical protein
VRRFVHCIEAGARAFVEATMMKLVLLSTSALLMLAAPANAEIWCLRDFGSTQRTCMFPELRDCVFAARAGGGRCERDTAEVPRERSKRPAAAQRNRDAFGRD